MLELGCSCQLVLACLWLLHQACHGFVDLLGTPVSTSLRTTRHVLSSINPHNHMQCCTPPLGYNDLPPGWPSMAAHLAGSASSSRIMRLRRLPC